jgi:hypothetical protein
MTTTPMAEPRRHFASDNWAGVHPDVLAAIAAANLGHMPSYGDDAITARATARIQALLGAPVAVHFVFNGTAANVLGLASSLETWQSVICSDVAHLEVQHHQVSARLEVPVAPRGLHALERAGPAKQPAVVVLRCRSSRHRTPRSGLSASQGLCPLRGSAFSGALSGFHSLFLSQGLRPLRGSPS